MQPLPAARLVATRRTLSPERARIDQECQGAHKQPDQADLLSPPTEDQQAGEDQSRQNGQRKRPRFRIADDQVEGVEVDSVSVTMFGSSACLAWMSVPDRVSRISPTMASIVYRFNHGSSSPHIPSGPSCEIMHPFQMLGKVPACVVPDEGAQRLDIPSPGIGWAAGPSGQRPWAWLLPGWVLRRMSKSASRLASSGDRARPAAQAVSRSASSRRVRASAKSAS